MTEGFLSDPESKLTFVAIALLAPSEVFKANQVIVR